MIIKEHTREEVAKFVHSALESFSGASPVVQWLQSLVGEVLHALRYSQI